MNPARGVALVYILLATTIVGGLIVAIYLRNLGNFMQKTMASPTPSLAPSSNSTSSPASSPSDETTNWKTYNGTGFFVKYPENWKADSLEPKEFAYFNSPQGITLSLASPIADGFSIGLNDAPIKSTNTLQVTFLDKTDAATETYYQDNSWVLNPPKERTKNYKGLYSAESDKPPSEEEKEIMKKIISSFKPTQ